MATAPPDSAPITQPSAVVRAAVSVLVLLHILAVFLGPFAMPPQTSELAYNCARGFQPYMDTLFLANGYRFFAPEPGPSHLVRFEATLDDGTVKEGVFPDREKHTPRLLYHRYFMLSEFINTLENPSAPPGRAEAYAKSYAQHLAHELNAKTVKLYLKRHFVPRTIEVRQGMRLSDKALYTEHPLGVFERDKP